MAIGAGRLAIGAAFLAAPVTSVRLLGLDTATASRVSWLARMTAARDGALGAGTLASAVQRRGEKAWLLAGSFSDAADAAVLTAALRAGRVRGFPVTAIAAGAAGAALAGAVATTGALPGR